MARTTYNADGSWTEIGDGAVQIQMHEIGTVIGIIHASSAPSAGDEEMFKYEYSNSEPIQCSMGAETCYLRVLSGGDADISVTEM